MKQLTDLNSWINLEEHSYGMRFVTLNSLQSSELRNSALNKSFHHLNVDFSNQIVNETTLELLIKLANERGLKERISELFNGGKVNKSESKPALHTALRILSEQPILVDNYDIVPDVLAVREQMQIIANKIRAGHWLGFSGKPITDIVNIGVGGSDLGPRFCINALSSLTAKHLHYHFISDMDPNAFENTVKELNPETTIFIVSSKSFTTKETLYNASKALVWLDNPQHVDKHFIAVTSNVTKAIEFGINHVLPIWDWVGGRYSLCSAINLITVIAIGFDQFYKLLEGAHSMDQHFLDTDFASNLPVLLALISIWNNNFLNIHNLLILVYAQELEYLVPYLQQLEMESNGKSIDNAGRNVDYATGQIVWGGLGNQVQHSYYQLLCQGTHKVSFDFLTIKQFVNEPIHEMFKAKKMVLTKGVDDINHRNGYIEGNKPLNHIQLTECTPFSIGQLIALYEHKIYTQAVIWDINPFDQPGVESAKRSNVRLDSVVY